MPLQTITIHRKGGYSDEIDADVLGEFAVHEYIPLWLWKKDGLQTWRGQEPCWTVSHVPTGWACLHTRTRRAALAARRAFVGCGVTFDFSDPAAMTAEQKRVGKDIADEWRGK